MSKQTTISVEILNAIRTNASDQYQDFVPNATRDNLAEVGEAIYNYDPTYNEFSGLLNKIAKTMTIKRMFENKLARFKSGTLATATDIEEYFIRKIGAKVQDKDGLNPLGKRNPSLAKVYYRENRNETYETTVSFKQIRQAFTSRDGVENLMNEIVQELYNSSNIDEYLIMKELLGTVSENATIYEVPDPSKDEKSAKRFVKTVRKASNDLEEPTSDFHTYFIPDPSDPDEMIRDKSIIQHTPKSSQVLFLNKDVEAEISVEVLATAFNVGKADFPVENVIVGDFGTSADDIVAILADDRLLRVFDTYQELLTQVNAQGAFTNYFLHIDQILALSPFANVVVFKVVDETEQE